MSFEIQSPYLYPKEAASYLGMRGKWREKVLIRWARQGKVRSGKVGRTHVFTIEQLDAYVESGRRRR